MTEQKYPELQRQTGYMNANGIFINFKYPRIKIVGNKLHDNKDYEITLLTEAQEKKQGNYPSYTAFAKFTGTEEAFTMEIGLQGYMAIKEIKATRFTKLNIRKAKGEKGAILLIQNQGQQEYNKPIQEDTTQQELPTTPNQAEENLWNTYTARHVTEQDLLSWVGYYVTADKQAGSYIPTITELRAGKIWEHYTKSSR